MKKKSLVAFLFLVSVGLLFSGCCQIKGMLTPDPAGPCVPREGCIAPDDCKPGPCVEREGCFGTTIKCPPPPPPPAPPPPPPAPAKIEPPPPPPPPPPPKKDRN